MLVVGYFPQWYIVIWQLISELQHCMGNINYWLIYSLIHSFSPEPGNLLLDFLYHSMSLGRPMLVCPADLVLEPATNSHKLRAYDVHEMIIKHNLEFNSSNKAGSLWVSKHFCIIYSTELYKLLTFMRVERERKLSAINYALWNIEITDNSVALPSKWLLIMSVSYFPSEMTPTIV